MKKTQIRIDVDRHEVVFGYKPVHLPPKEWEILRALVAAQGKLMTREQLLEGVWGNGRDIDIDTRTVDQHIARLRRRFPKVSVIETVTLYGYRITLGAVAA